MTETDPEREPLLLNPAERARHRERINEAFAASKALSENLWNTITAEINALPETDGEETPLHFGDILLDAITRGVAEGFKLGADRGQKWAEETFINRAH